MWTTVTLYSAIPLNEEDHRQLLNERKLWNHLEAQGLLL